MALTGFVFIYNAYPGNTPLYLLQAQNLSFRLRCASVRHRDIAMGAYEMFFVVIIAAVLWIVVYCLILIQRCSADSNYGSNIGNFLDGKRKDKR